MAEDGNRNLPNRFNNIRVTNTETVFSVPEGYDVPIEVNNFTGDNIGTFYEVRDRVNEAIEKMPPEKKSFWLEQLKDLSVKLGVEAATKAIGYKLGL